MNFGPKPQGLRPSWSRQELGTEPLGIHTLRLGSVNDPLPNPIYLFRFTYFWALHLALSEEDLSQIGGIAFVAFYQAQGLIHSPL